MDDLVPQSIRDDERAAVDSRARRCGGARGNVAGGAPYLGEQSITGPNGIVYRPTRRGFGGAHEVGEGFDIFPLILRLRNGIKARTETDEAATGGVLVREQRAGNAHLI